MLTSRRGCSHRCQADIADRAVYGEAKVACELVGMCVQLL